MAKEIPQQISRSSILPMFFSPFFINKCQKGKIIHVRNYSSKEPSELELSAEAERAMVEAEAGARLATWASKAAFGVERGASGLNISVPAVF